MFRFEKDNVVEKSYMAKKHTYKKVWYHIDAEDKVLGRMAVEIATILMGKHRPTYTPHVDAGDFVVVTNAEKIAISGKKRENKLYHTYSGYPGGLKTKNFDEKQKTHPEEIIMLAVRRMLPKSRLGRAMLKKLKVYTGSEHPHKAQCPTTWEM